MLMLPTIVSARRSQSRYGWLIHVIGPVPGRHAPQHRLVFVRDDQLRPEGW